MHAQAFAQVVEAKNSGEVNIRVVTAPPTSEANAATTRCMPPKAYLGHRAHLQEARHNRQGPRC